MMSRRDGGTLPAMRRIGNELRAFVARHPAGSAVVLIAFVAALLQGGRPDGPIDYVGVAVAFMLLFLVAEVARFFVRAVAKWAAKTA